MRGATMSSNPDLGDEESSPLAGEFDSSWPGRRRGSPRRLALAALLTSALAAAAVLLLAATRAKTPANAALRAEAEDAIIVKAADDGSCEWEVVWPTGVHVRSGRSIYTSALSVKAPKERFWARQDGDWVALVDQPGYCLIRNGEHLLLKRTATCRLVAQPTEAAVTLLPPAVQIVNVSKLMKAHATVAPPATPEATQAPVLMPTATSAPKVKETPGHLEWEVIGSEPVYARMDPSATALILRTQTPGELLVGERQGNWLRLWHNRGYVLLSTHGIVQLEERSVAYSLAPGSCSDVVRFPVTDASACEAAARTLGLPSINVQLTEVAPLGEPGCFLGAAGQLKFSRLASPPERAGGAGETHLCSNQAYRGASDAVAARTPASEPQPPSEEPTTTMWMRPTTTTVATTLTSTVPTTTIWMRPSLFCWSVAMAEKRGEQVDSEVALMRNAYSSGRGLFACNDWDVFSDQVVPLAGADGPNTTAIPGPLSQMGSIPNMPQYKMLLNTGVFFRAWDKVLRDKKYERYDWTIKLDPDCVFFPDRARTRLRNGNYNPDQPIYFKNCERWNSMQGPTELFSIGAMREFAAQMSSCKQQISQQGIGEDIFLQKCTAQLGMQAVSDWTLLSDQYCRHDTEACRNGWTAAFHPYKSVQDWNNCWGKAIAGR